MSNPVKSIEDLLQKRRNLITNINNLKSAKNALSGNKALSLLVGQNYLTFPLTGTSRRRIEISIDDDILHATDVLAIIERQLATVQLTTGGKK